MLCFVGSVIWGGDLIPEVAKVQRGVRGRHVGRCRYEELVADATYVLALASGGGYGTIDGCFGFAWFGVELKVVVVGESGG